MIRIKQIMRRAVADKTAPSISLAFSKGDEPATHCHVGQHSFDPESQRTGDQTIYDLASLTKPLTTVSWVLRLISDGRLTLEDRLGQHLPNLQPDVAAIPIWRLLNHTSGLPAHRRYFEGLGASVLRTGQFARANRSIQRMLDRAQLETREGALERYSDIGFLLLQRACESAAETSLEQATLTLPGHGPNALHFRPLSTPSFRPNPQYAATERCPWRNRLLQGEVHDDNCWVMGGVAGHAGLFGSLGAVHRFGRKVLEVFTTGTPLDLGIDPELLRYSLKSRWMHPQGTRVLGWDTPSPGGSTSGRFFSRHAIGHLGFTGTSIWIDLDAQITITLLTNRVSPSRLSTGIRTFRPLIHDAVRRHLADQT